MKCWALLLTCWILAASPATASGSEDEFQVYQQGDEWQLLLFAEALSWQVAEQTCVAHGGHLASISSALEEDAIEAYCFQQLSADKCWIGLNDLQDEGHFVFTDATPYNYTRWYTAPWSRKWASEPNDGLNLAQEDCVLLAKNDLGWHDEHCNGAHPFICRRATPPPPANDTTGSANSSLSASSSSSSSASASTSARSATHHQLLWGLLGGVVGGLLAFEAVYLSVLAFRRRGGSDWSHWRPSLDSVAVLKQVEMRGTGADEMPDLVEGGGGVRGAVRDSLRGLWARSRGWFSKGYSELPS